MLNCICFFNNKVFVPCYDQSCISLVAFCYKKGIKGNSDHSFKEVFRIKIPLKSCSPATDIFLEVVDNYITGFKCIVVMVCSIEKYALLHYDPIANKLIPVREGLSKKLSVSDIFLTDGPTCVTIFDGVLKLHSLITSKHYPIYLQHLTSFHFTKVLQILCLGPLIPDDPSYVCYLFILSFNVCSTQKIISLAVSVNYKNDSVVWKILLNCSFFPETFENVAHAIHVSPSFLPLDTINNIEQINWKENSCILCSSSECFIFYEGFLKYCCTISSLSVQVMCIKTDTPLSESLDLVLLATNKTAVYLSKKKEYNELQVTKSWLNIDSVLFGDMLLKGTMQLLMLKNTSFPSWQDECLLIDFHSFMPVDLISQNALPDQCLSATISGLLTKVQAGKLAITAKEQEISNKAAATIDALMRLSNTAPTNEPEFSRNSFEESLVDIILSKDENKRYEADVLNSNLYLNVDNYSTKIIDGHWYLYWRFCNEGERPICNPLVLISVQGKQIQCLQKMFIHEGSSFSHSDQFARQINSRQMFSIVAKLEIPSFSKSNLEASVVLSWYVGSSSEFDNELFLEEKEKNLVQHQLSSYKLISIEDMFQQSLLRDISVTDDLILLRASQQRIVLTISTLHSNLSEIKQILCHDSVERMQVSETIDLKCFIFKEGNSPLFGTSLVTKLVDPKTIEVQAFTRNDRETFLLIQLLYQLFPQDTMIIPHSSTEREVMEWRRRIVCCLQLEMDLLVASLGVYNVHDKLMADLSEIPDSLTQTIVVPKKDYCRIRRALVKKECMTDSCIRNSYSEKGNYHFNTSV